MVINEMAGSGGDLMPWMFKFRKVGTLVGKRTWGGLVHTADTPPFIDGGSMIAPRGGFFTRDGKWAVENEGTSPDIDVENWPKDVIAGHDMQLETAVQTALKQLAEHPVHRDYHRAAPAHVGQADQAAAAAQGWRGELGGPGGAAEEASSRRRQGGLVRPPLNIVSAAR